MGPVGQGGIDESVVCIDLEVFDRTGELPHDLSRALGFHDRITATLQNQRRPIDLRGELIGVLPQRVDLLKKIDRDLRAPDQVLYLGIVQISILQELAQEAAQARIVEAGAAERFQVAHERFGDEKDDALSARAELPERCEQD